MTGPIESDTDTLNNDGTETTPLLAAGGKPVKHSNDGIPPVQTTPEEEEGNLEEYEDDTSLPKLQIMLLCFARLIDPITFFGIFPFINFQIRDTGVPEAEVGFYSGLIESLFSLVQACLMIAWGRLADRYGRKPGLVVSLVGVSSATVLFGFSKNLWQMMLFRCLAGAFSGSTVTIRTMIGENSTKKTQATAFGYLQLFSNLGIFLGPLLGGIFTEPARQYPSIFGRVKFFEQNPYALSTIVLGLTGYVVAIICAIYLKETLNTKSDESSRSSTLSLLEIMKFPGVAMVVFIYSHITLLAHTYTSILPLFWFTSVNLGGCSFNAQTISVFMGLAGLGQGMWMVLFFPFLHRRFGTSAILRGCAFVWPIFFAIWPFCNFLLRNHFKTAFWVLAPFNDFFGVGVSMAFAAIQLALNDISPFPSALGMLNAIALTLTTALRAFAPGLMTSIYAIGVERQILWGYLAWLVNITLAISCAIAVLYLPAKAEGAPVKGK